jgi:hypothetical protein
MTDRIYALTVFLEKPTRDDDVEEIVNAILMIKGVTGVKHHIADVALEWGKEAARRELIEKLWTVLEEDRKT